VSHLYHLRTTAQARPAIGGAYDGPLYTADARAAVTRPYRCAGCGAVPQVGPGARWSTIARLKADGCPDCRGTVLRPMALGRAGPRQAAGR
jgi:DNA-directed RNA polymerase subunit RPC12/RpoP